LQELYAGASKRDRRPLERLERQFDRVGRILVPNLGDWTRAGQVLAQLAARYGYERVGKERLTNDTLIAMSAARYGITIVTSNGRDFARLTQFRPFHYQVLSI
jgi:predicted nucleic acid-binding protein